MKRLIPLLLLALLSATVGAQPPQPGQPPQPSAWSEEQETRYRQLISQLRCLVCQNQTIADSNAPLAVDLRDQVQTQLAAGRSEAEIRSYLTDRYGDFVLYKPPVKSTTALLWYGPATLLVLAVFVLVWIIRRRTKMPADRFEPDPDGP